MSRRRVGVIAAVVLLAALAPLALRSARALCAGRVDAYVAIAGARDQQRRLAAELAAGRDAGLRQELGALGAALAGGALDLVLVVKQSDPIAFPVHAVVGTGLELASCDRDAIADQWLKAARHAWADWAAEITAAALARRRGADPAELLGARLEREAAEQPWFASNLDRVARHDRAAASP